MHYSLSSRFRGTFLGAAIAEILGSAQGELNTEFPVWGGTPNTSLFELQEQPVQVNQVAWLSANSLIQVGDLDSENWHRSGAHQQTRPIPLTPADMLVGIIPVSLFFHEDEARLRQKVLQVTEAGHAALELQSGALAVAYAIAQSLQEKLDPTCLIAQTIAYLPQPSEPLVKQLEKVQILLEERAGLETTLFRLLGSQPAFLPTSVLVALAFYCFLSTLEDYRLTVVRAARMSHKFSLVAILAGTLSGAYNGVNGIPTGYRLALLRNAYQTFQGSKTIETDVLELADQLLANWSGAYEPTNASIKPKLNSELAVAAPGVIQPR